MVGLATTAITIVFDLGFLLASYCRTILTALRITPGKVQHEACHTCYSPHGHPGDLLVQPLLLDSLPHGEPVSEDTHSLIGVTCHVASTLSFMV